MDEFPDWNETMRSSRIVDFDHIDKLSYIPTSATVLLKNPDIETMNSYRV